MQKNNLKKKNENVIILCINKKLSKQINFFMEKNQKKKKNINKNKKLINNIILPFTYIFKQKKKKITNSNIKYNKYI